MLPFFIQIIDIVKVEKKSNDVLFGSYPQFKKKGRERETMNKKATRHKPTIISGLVRAQGYLL